MARALFPWWFLKCSLPVSGRHSSLLGFKSNLLAWEVADQNAEPPAIKVFVSEIC